MTPLPPFGNITDEERDNEVVVIDKDYDHVSDLVREGDLFDVIALVDNAKKCIIIYSDALDRKERCCKNLRIRQIIRMQWVQWL